MEPTRPKLPREAIQLYNLFIHGEISRRDFMEGVQRFAIGGLTAAAIVQALMPNYALGQQVSKTDDRIKATYETVPSPQGNGSIKGYLVRPASAGRHPDLDAKVFGVAPVFAQQAAQLVKRRERRVAGGIGQRHKPVAVARGAAERRLGVTAVPDRHAA